MAILALLAALGLTSCHVQEAPLADPRLGDPIHIGGSQPAAIQVADGFVWVTTTAGQLLRIDPRLGRQLGSPIDLGPPSRSRALPLAVVGGGALWIIRPGDGIGSHCFVERLDLRSGRRSRRVRVRGAARTGSEAAGTLWLLTDASRPDDPRGPTTRVLKVTGTEHLSVAEALRAKGNPPISDVDADQDAVWALGIDGTITRIDLRSGRRAKRAARGLGESIAPGARTVWVLRIDGRATQVDRESLVMRRTIAVGGYTQDIVAAGDSAWVLLQQSRGIVRLDATTNSVIDTIQTGLTDFSARMALGAGALWLTDPRERSVRRIPIG